MRTDLQDLDSKPDSNKHILPFLMDPHSFFYCVNDPLEPKAKQDASSAQIYPLSVLFLMFQIVLFLFSVILFVLKGKLDFVYNLLVKLGVGVCKITHPALTITTPRSLATHWNKIFVLFFSPAGTFHILVWIVSPGKVGAVKRPAIDWNAFGSDPPYCLRIA